MMNNAPESAPKPSTKITMLQKQEWLSTYRTFLWKERLDELLREFDLLFQRVPDFPARLIRAIREGRISYATDYYCADGNWSCWIYGHLPREWGYLPARNLNTWVLSQWTHPRTSTPLENIASRCEPYSTYWTQPEYQLLLEVLSYYRSGEEQEEEGNLIMIVQTRRNALE